MNSYTPIHHCTHMPTNTPLYSHANQYTIVLTCPAPRLLRGYYWKVLFVPTARLEFRITEFSWRDVPYVRVKVDREKRRGGLESTMCTACPACIVCV